MTTIFVYGTLRKNQSNHHYLESAEYLGNASTKDNIYTMFSNGYYPGVKLMGNSKIHGELYNVNNTELKRIRNLEGYRESAPTEGLYDEQNIQVIDKNNNELTAKTYIYNYSMPHIIESGNWNAI
jgi:gamma-glutamylcyclotransferase (GGCT)/AIG2-like uncharacterized protein YtfP